MGGLVNVCWAWSFGEKQLSDDARAVEITTIELSEDSPDDFEGLDASVAHIANLLSTEPADKEFYCIISNPSSEAAFSYQEAIEDITMRMGAGMTKFICKEVETIDDYDEYCHYVGLVGLRLSKLFHASGSEDLASDFLSNSMGLFLQKTNIIQDYLEDINEIPKSRMFWPRQIWSKYVNKLEDLKYKENSAKAVECLNDMVTNALIHVEDCLTYMSALRDPSIFRFCAIPQVCLQNDLGPEEEDSKRLCHQRLICLAELMLYFYTVVNEEEAVVDLDPSKLDENGIALVHSGVGT
ncbi:Squalene synthase 3 [Camellia lanceoleosa]|uniref:Squalene synthase 3 n=1 Tax=Camellia lanceoleosa TaxID=1840588 RepID=A0ACC0IR24_9ERIC|nr:Squalene synthase 3 [Camellia lanceoleosa]